MILYSIVLLNLISFLLFFIFYKSNKFLVWNGFFLSMFILTLGISIIYFVFTYPTFFSTTTSMFIFLILAIPAFIILAFGSYILIVFLLFNTRYIFKKEQRSLSNSLSLILAIIIILFIITSKIIYKHLSLEWIKWIWYSIDYVVGFYIFNILIFLISLLLCNLRYHKKNKDFIIILGCGLINGNVTPLLASRINYAVKFYKSQHIPSKIICSGGQGSDESIPESLAMYNYLIEQNIPSEDIIIEDKSTNTLENMQFSKIIMDNAKSSYNAIYVTSNYHLLRGGIYARKCNLIIDGIGAKTAFYFIPNALIREYIAFFWLYKKSFIFTSIIIFIMVFSFNVFAFFI